MRTALTKYKAVLLRGVACVLFYSGLCRMIGLLVNRFQPKRKATGALAFPFIRKRRSRNLQILVYHRVNDDCDPFFPATPVAVFRRQMEYLASCCAVCPLEDAVYRMKRQDLPDNAVAVTFDDGYRDNYLQAFPLLKEFSIPATIFLATDAIGSGKLLWHDRVFAAFRQTREPFLTAYGDCAKTYPLRTVEEKLVALVRARRFLRSLGEQERPVWIARLGEQLRVEDKTHLPGLMLTWDEVKIMQRHGVAFGSHSVSHPILPRLSAERAVEEIYTSKQLIEEQLGTPARGFAYPNGTEEDYNDQIKGIIKDAGYACAVTTVFGANEIGRDVFELRRGQPWEHHLPTFATKLSWYRYVSSEALPSGKGGEMNCL